MQRRHLRFGHLSESVAEVRRLAAAEYERAGNWSLEENLDHLNRAMRMTFDGPPFRLWWPFTKLAKGLLFGKMRRGEPMRGRGPAPKSLLPDRSVAIDRAVSEFEGLAERIEAEGAKLDSFHPIFGPLNTEEWRLMHRWHAAHHLSFLIPRGDSVVEVGG